MFRLILILIIYFTLSLQVYSIEQEVIIKKKVDNFIITNLDIKKEIKYIISLNPSLAEKIEKNNLITYAENSLINEKIKYIELSKFFDTDNVNNIPDIVINNFYKRLGFDNLNQFKQYLNSKNLNYNIVLEKLYLEHLWNSLIYQKYNKKVNIDKEKIKNNLKKKIDSQKKINNFNLSEIIFTVKNKSELDNKYQKISTSIEGIGFEDTARLHSASESAQFGGTIGWVSENQLSAKIYKIIENLDEGKFTKPIKVPDGYLILYIKEKKIEEKKIDLDEALSRAIAYEKNKQLNEFSRLYFKRLEVNTIIE